eukprot:TRINITY_DN4459_c0_g1_i1.p1 TRINITY_DN4459_c0_g1~~TRINITY_DN4459_c0_g1_i1.p1  ORF type:complete len:504 (-),score=168.09 TRINITY_DN4459_c0_g1_i1:33-1544(-)
MRSARESSDALHEAAGDDVVVVAIDATTTGGAVNDVDGDANVVSRRRTGASASAQRVDDLVAGDKAGKDSGHNNDDDDDGDDDNDKKSSKRGRRRRRVRKQTDDTIPLLEDKVDRKWRLETSDFLIRTDTSGLRRNVAKFYWRQNRLIKAFHTVDVMHGHGTDSDATIEQGERDARECDDDHDDDLRTAAQAYAGVQHWTVRWLVFASFAANVLLLLGKLFATVASGSLAVLASMLDSFLDLLSGSILYMVQRAMSQTNYYRFPAGKSRLEPLGIIVFASVMFTATLVVIIESLKSLVATAKIEELSDIVFGIMAFTVLAKLTLFILCWLTLRTHSSPSLEALAQDHRNDCLTNTFGAVALWLAFKYAWWLDATAAILMSAWIMLTWARTGWAHVQIMSGKSASPAFLSQLTFLAWNHDARVLAIDTVRAFHLSFGYLVEVDIVLPEDMRLREAHDIGEALQIKFESLPDVERAFVHLDFEVEHKPEHRQQGANRNESQDSMW